MTNDTVFRFVLSNATLGSLPILEPIGWDEAELNLERDSEFHSIIEFYDQPMTFFKEEENGVDGGYDYIKSAIDTLGPDGEVEIYIYISEDSGDTYQTLFAGLVDLSTYTNIDSYKIECGIIRNDIWSTFKNRKANKVNISGTADLDGNTRVLLTPENMLLTSQKLRQVYLGRQDEDTTIDYVSVPNNEYGIVDFGQLELDEIREKFNYPRVQTATLPDELFAVEYAGDYNITCDIYLSTAVFGGNYTASAVNTYIQINNDTPIAFTETDLGGPVDFYTRYRYSATHTLEKGDFIRIYFQNVSGGAFSWVWFANLFFDSFLKIEADTTFDDTYAKVYPLHEAFQSVCDRILGDDDTLYSEFLGNQTTQRQSYASDGCGSSFAIAKGLHIRGYDPSEKIFSTSFDDLWSGANPILNLALQYNESLGVLEILDKDSIYESGIAIYLDYVDNIETTINTSHTFKKIEIGYQKWESEDYSGIDDPQTKKEYATPLKRIGEEISLLSSFIGASLAIENTRRKTLEQGKDYKLDNDTFIIALDTSSLYATPPVYTPDLDDEVTGISNLLNSDTRYNLKLTPLRNFLRWYNYFNGSFYPIYSVSGAYRFMGGEGNYSMRSAFTSSCAGQGSGENIGENDNLSMGLDAGYHTNEMITFDHPLSYTEYTTIKANRNKKIMVSETNANYIECRIDSIKYQITKGIATFKLWKI